MTREFLPPSGRTYRALRNQARSLSRAFSEWVDNSFGEHRGDATLVQIFIEGRTVTVLDNGRAPEKLGDVPQLGAGAGSGGYDSGRFGWGGSVNQLGFTSEAKMWALRADQYLAHDTVDWDEVVETGQLWVDSEWRPMVPRNCPERLRALGHGFMLRMKILPGKHISPSTIKDHLSKEFAAPLKAGRRIEWHEDGEVEVLQPWTPGDLSDVRSVRYEVPDYEGLAFEVEAGWSDTLPLAQRGFDVEYGPRRLVRDTKPLDGYRGPAIFGWIRLEGKGWLDHLESEKSGIETVPLREYVQQKARETVQPLIDALMELHRDKALIEIAGDLAKTLGSLSPKVGGKGVGFPDTTDWKPRGGKRPKKKKKKKAEQQGRAQRQIYVHGESNEVCDEAPFVISAPLDEDWDIALNQDVPEIRRALDETPPDRPLLQQWLASAIAVDLLFHGRLVALGLYSEEEFEKLRDKNSDDQLLMAPFVIKHLLDKVHASTVENGG